MHSLPEYRCTCGKLLFKGLMLVSIIEFKCDRCNRVRTIRRMNPTIIGNSAFVILLDAQGNIVNLSDSMLKLLGYSWDELSQLDFFRLCPIVSPLFFQKLWKICHTVPVSMRTAVFFQAKGKSPKRATIEFKFLTLQKEQYLFAIANIVCQCPHGSDGKPLPYVMVPHPQIMYFELDSRNRVVDSEYTNMGLLGYTSSDLAKVPLHRLWSSYGINRHHLKIKRPFEILDNVLMAKNNKPMTVETYFLPNFKPTVKSSERWWVYSFLR